MSEYMKVPTDFFETIAFDAGIICTGFTPSTGAVTGIIGAIDSSGFKFASNPQFEDYGEDVGNIPNNTKEMLRIIGYDPTASGNYVNVSNELIMLLEAAGAYAVDGSTEDDTHIVPSHILQDGDFEDLYFLSNYGKYNTGTGATAPYAGYVCVHLKNALNRSGFQWQTKKNGKGAFPFEFHGHYSISSMDDPPFEYYIRKGAVAA